MLNLLTILTGAMLWLAPMNTHCPIPGEPEGEPVDFTEAFDILMQWEGGDTLHEDTRGILTKWGVASTAHPHVDVASLTKEEAMEIAREKYWIPSRANALPGPWAYMVFDLAYNAGPPRAVVTLQRALNDVVLARRLDFRPLVVDGRPGPNTLTRAYALSHRGEHEFVQRCFIYNRMDFYTHLARTNPDEYGASYNGWLRRALEAT